jgi:hypothetical protein
VIAGAELAVQIGLTKAFINADPITVQLLRRPRTPDGAGGMTIGEPVAQAPQVFRLLPQEDGATARTTANGESATPEFMLMGSPGVNMQRFDQFVLTGRRFEIVYIDDRQYEVKGEAVYLGS